MNAAIARDSHLEQVIEQRTWGRMHHVCVERSSNRVVLHGTAPTYYVVQQAVAAVMCELEHSAPGSHDTIELDVAVGRI
ncbi:MAG: hypothetical protein AB7K24_00810 [Gemmataceae bacterium]